MEETNQPKIQLEMNEEHSNPLFSNNVQIFPPLTPEIVLEFNRIDQKKTWKNSENGKPSKIFLEPVVSVQLSQNAALDVLKTLARVFNVELSEKRKEPEIIQEEVKGE